MTSQLKTILILLLLLIPALLYNLGERPVYKIQEVRIAETAREMVVSGDWLVPRYNGELRLQKPPLPYWLTALSYKAFGVNATAVRLPALIFGMLSVALMFVWLRREAGALVAVNSILVLAASYIGIRYFRSGEADAVLMLFICAACILGYRMQQYGKDKHCQWLFGLALGLGFLSKGPAALAIPLLTLLASSLCSREPKKFLANFSLPGLILLVIGAGAWYAWIFWQLPDAANLFFGRQLDQTFISGTHAKPVWWYLAHLFEFFAPWGFLLIPAGWWSYRQLKLNSLPPYARFAWLWLGVVFVLLTLTINKQMQYALLLAPPMAVVIGHYLAFADGVFAKINKVLFGIIVLGALALLAYALYKGAAVLALLAILLFPLLLRWLWKTEAPGYATLLVAVIALFAYLYSEDYVSKEPRKVAAQTLMALVGSGQPLYQLRIETRPDDGALSFYAGRVVAPVSAEQLPVLLQKNPELWLVAEEAAQIPAAKIELLAEADDLKLYKIQAKHD